MRCIAYMPRFKAPAEALAIRLECGERAELVPTQQAPGAELPEMVIHNNRAKRELGWRPRPAETSIVETAEGLRDSDFWSSGNPV